MEALRGSRFTVRGAGPICFNFPMDIGSKQVIDYNYYRSSSDRMEETGQVVKLI